MPQYSDDPRTEAKSSAELDVAEDMQFQRRWWRFERIVWAIFAGILAVDLSGLLGQGPLAKAHAHPSDAAMRVDYDYIERFGTASTMTVHFGPNAVRNGKVQLWVSDSLLQKLGEKRVSPAPQSSQIGKKGLLYIWPATGDPDFVSFALMPKHTGMTSFTLILPATGGRIHRKVFVMP